MYHRYEKRREHYYQLANKRGIAYSTADVSNSIRSRIRTRGYMPVPRQLGEIHTFAWIPQYSWHKHLLPDLKELGPVTLFDFVSLGYSRNEFKYSGKWDKARIGRRQEMVEKVFPAFVEAHQKRPVDWIFCYGAGEIVSAGVIRKLTHEFGVPSVNITFDDKQWWDGPNVGEHFGGTKDLTQVFDLYVTSSRLACEWHLVENGRPIYMPEGFDNTYYHPRSTKMDLPVSFVGAGSGFRQSVISYLKERGVSIYPFGAGWPGVGYVDDIVDIFNRSVINLGMGGIGYLESLTDVKGRDFEVPGTGGGVYLTSFNPDLAQHFVIGEEILCYRNRDEMLELIRYYLSHPDEAREISQAGRNRCLREHRWLHRYKMILEILEIFKNG